MTRIFLSKLLIITVASLAFIKEVHGQDYGKVVCMGKTKVPEKKLYETLENAMCILPKDASPTDEAMGALIRCAYKHMKAFTPPSTFNKSKAEDELGGIFPMKYQASFKTMNSACLDAHAVNAKGVKEDASGKTWVELYKCFKDWYSNELCK